LIALIFFALPLAATAQHSTLQDFGDALTAPLPAVVISSAKEIVPLDPVHLPDGPGRGGRSVPGHGKPGSGACHKGEWRMDPEFFARSFRVHWNLRDQIHIHVNSDAGLAMVLHQLKAILW